MLHGAFRTEFSIREMKNRLSKYLKLARAGNDVVITDRGKPVARLTLVEPTAKDEEAQAIRRINALPWMRPGKGDKLASDRVIEDRIRLFISILIALPIAFVRDYNAQCSHVWSLPWISRFAS